MVIKSTSTITFLVSFFLDISLHNWSNSQLLFFLFTRILNDTIQVKYMILKHVIILLLAKAKTIEALKRAQTIEDLMVDKKSAKLVKQLVAALKEVNESKMDVAAGK
jgi:hypothetical protein